MSATASCHFPYMDKWKNYCNKNKTWAFIDSVLSGYAQLAFNDNTFSGILMIIATWIASPALCINAVWGTTVATATAYAIKIPDIRIRSGSYGFNAALACLAITQLVFPSQGLSFAMLSISAIVAAFTVFLLKFAESMLAKWNISAFVIPYCVSMCILLAAFTAIGITHPTTITLDALLFTNKLSDWSIQELLTIFLHCGSQILWHSSMLSGILYFIALLFASRWDTLNVIAAIIASMTVAVILGLPKDSVMTGLYGYNAILLIQVLDRSFLLNRKICIWNVIMSGLTVILCCVYQLILPQLGIGTILAFPYMTLAYLVIGIRRRRKDVTYISAKYWGVPETIAEAFKK